MDEPSVQLQLDLSRSVQHELATRRPLLHRLQRSSWVLQIPRPTQAVRHGSRFYYNILVDPCFVRAPTPPNNWFSQPSPALDHLQTVAALEELLRDLETLTNDLRPESSRKSNVLGVNDTAKSETLVDAVVVTSLGNANEESFRQIHPDVPVYASQESTKQLSALQHFRTLETINEIGSDGCKDWRSTTALAGLPEWVGLSTLPKQDDSADTSHTLMVAFNNYHDNSSARLAKVRALKGKQKISLPIENEDFAEAVLFTSSKKLSHGVIPASHADPTIYPLAVIYGGSTPAEHLGAFETHGHALGTGPEITATYHVSGRNLVAEKGRGFLAWLIAKARFTTQDAHELQPDAVDSSDLDMEDVDTQSSQRIALCGGESKVLI